MTENDRHYPEGQENHCISCAEPFPCPAWHENHPPVGFVLETSNFTTVLCL